MRPKRLPLAKWLVVLLSFAALASGLAAQDPDFQIRTRLDLVVVPVSVETDDDDLISGLTKDDFVIYEDGVQQTITNFTDDPVPLSAVLLVDSGLSPDAFTTVQNAIPVLLGTFSDADEVAVYRFDRHITKLMDFTLDKALAQEALATLHEIEPSPPAMRTGPFSMPGPSVNGIPILSGAQIQLRSTPSQTKLLHDAIYTASEELSRRPTDRRKIIVVVADGQHHRNDHSFEDVRDRLIRQQVQVFALGMDDALLSRRLSILDSYADDTGGDLCIMVTQHEFEECYARSIEQARNQYVLGYVSNQKPSGGVPVFREIRVEVTSGDYDTHHRRGYFQAP